VWATSEPAFIRDVTHDANFPRVMSAADAGLHGAFGFPVLFGDKVAGVLEFFSREIREPDAGLIGMLGAIGSQIGQFIGRKRLEDDLHAAERAARARLEEEMAVALQVQTALLPRSIDVAGLEIYARMMPASEIGGDYYDVLPAERGCWIGIGDVAGHGLTAGLIMLMVQSAIGALARELDDQGPREVLGPLNQLVWENVRHRLEGHQHVTLSLLRYWGDGRFTVAGRHEDLIVWRAATGRVETIATPGTWLNIVPDIEEFNVEQAFDLAEGDVLLLYTDGILEAQDEAGTLYGIERLCQLVERVAREPVRRIGEILRASAVEFAAPLPLPDDLTLLVIRRTTSRDSEPAP
jgi:sigma-B regulation protein RsbU (phosphoserine phosphatase)